MKTPWTHVLDRPLRRPKDARRVGVFFVAISSFSIVTAPFAEDLHGQVAGGERGALVREIRVGVLAFLNAPTTLRFDGNARIPTGSVVEGSVAVLGGSLDLAGRINGDLVVVNGDLRVHPGGRVEGSVRILGGTVREAPGSWHGGTLDLDPTPLRYRIRGGVVELDDPTLFPPPRLLTAEVGRTSIRPWLRSAGAYNRVEGLPMELGGVFETLSRNPLRLEAFALWRSVSGLELDGDNLGSIFRLRQEVGGNGEAGFELTRFSRIVPFEDRGLSNLESSLSTFLLRRDLRDYFEEEGWSFAFTAHPVDAPLRLRLEYREDENRTAQVGSPWTLRDNELPWRALPLVAEGTSRSLVAEFLVDTRNEVRDPSYGWWIEGKLQRRVGGTQRIPVLPELGEDPVILGTTTRIAETESLGLATAGRLDIRRYNRLSPSTRLNLRFLVSGPLNAVPLPPQDQTTLGGEGSLPGHPRFSVDCGARSRQVALPSASETDEPQAVYPAYGCDGVALGQIELQGRLPFSWAPQEGAVSWETGSLLRLEPAWTVFLGAGRGWRAEDPTPADLREDSPLRMDIGTGVFVGPLGVYWTVPLNRRDRGLNFFVRISHRF